MLKLWVRKYLQFYAENFCLSKPMLNISNKCIDDKHQIKTLRDVKNVFLCFSENFVVKWEKERLAKDPDILNNTRVVFTVSTKFSCSNLSQCMRYPTMLYVRPAKLRISLHIRAV